MFHGGSQTNATLLQTYGGNAWRIHNYLLEATAKQTEQALEELRELTVEVNRERKNMQVWIWLFLRFDINVIKVFRRPA